MTGRERVMLQMLFFAQLVVVILLLVELLGIKEQLAVGRVSA
jgi:hypothetical protein